MSFLWPYALAGLIFVPVLIVVYFALAKRANRPRPDATLGQGYGDVSNLGWKRHVAPLLSLLAITSMLVGFSRPQATIDVPEFRSTVILVFDTSQSMIADDIEPSRLDAAKVAAKAFVEDQPDSVEVGIVSFGSLGASTLRPTDDRTAIDASIDRLELAGGTSLTEGLFAGLSAIAKEPIIFLPDEDGQVEIPAVDFGGFGSAVIVIFSDGEDTTEQDPTALAELAATNGIRIYPVGVGTTEGAVMELDGFSMSSSLNEEVLQELADRSNGTYFQADSTDDLASVTNSIERDLEVNEELFELTSFFGIGALVLLAFAALVAMATKGRIL